STLKMRILLNLFSVTSPEIVSACRCLATEEWERRDLRAISEMLSSPLERIIPSTFTLPYEESTFSTSSTGHHPLLQLANQLLGRDERETNQRRPATQTLPRELGLYDALPGQLVDVAPQLRVVVRRHSHALAERVVALLRLAYRDVSRIALLE